MCILGVIHEFITLLITLVLFVSQDFVKKPPSLLLLCLHLFNTAHLLAISCFSLANINVCQQKQHELCRHKASLASALPQQLVLRWLRYGLSLVEVLEPIAKPYGPAVVPSVPGPECYLIRSHVRIGLCFYPCWSSSALQPKILLLGQSVRGLSPSSSVVEAIRGTLWDTAHSIHSHPVSLWTS